MEKEYNYTCPDCGSVFTIVTAEEDQPTMCPFCGSDLDEDYVEEELNEEDE